jgi:hypothetical protein
MTTAQQLDQYQTELDGVLLEAVEFLVAELADWTSLTPAQAATRARDIVPILVEQFGDEAALAAADAYDDMRSALPEALAIAYAAQLAPVLGDDLVQDELDWALSALFPTEEQRVGFDLDAALLDALSKIGNVLQLMVGNQYRDTIAVSAADDPMDGIRYARHASANACAFCRLMATRGAKYHTAEADENGVLRVVVTGDVDPDDITQRIRGPRGTRGEGEKFHDNCKCIAVAVFPGDTLEEAPYVAQWREDYAAARADVEGPDGVAQLKDILAHMRENTGAR